MVLLAGPLVIGARGLYSMGMSDNNPYANDASGFDEYSEPERTSALAVTSLVMSLICCIPGFGLIGSALGVVAMLGIGKSRGRVGGKGMAMAGIIIGVLMTVAWVSFFAMSVSALKQAADEFFVPANDLMTEIEAGNFDAARAAFPNAPIANTTDEQFEAFRAAYQSEVGAFESIPTGLVDIWTMYLEVGQQMQGFQQPAGGQVILVPVPARFDVSGPTVILVRLDPMQQNTGDNPITDIAVVLPDGSELSLMPQSLPALPFVPALPGGDSDDDDEDEDDEP